MVVTGVNTSDRREARQRPHCNCWSQVSVQAAQQGGKSRHSTRSFTYPERKGGFCQEDHRNRAQPSQRLDIQRKQTPEALTKMYQLPGTQVDKVARPHARSHLADGSSCGETCWQTSQGTLPPSHDQCSFERMKLLAPEVVVL